MQTSSAVEGKCDFWQAETRVFLFFFTVFPSSHMTAGAPLVQAVKAADHRLDSLFLMLRVSSHVVFSYGLWQNR